MKNTIKIGLFGIGLDTYWPQFDGLLDKLIGYQEQIKNRIAGFGVEVADAGMVDNPGKAREAADFLKSQDVEIVFLYISTYALSSTVLPVAQKLKVPIVILDPHGEYSTLKFPNDSDHERMKKFGIKPKGYLERIQNFSPDTEINSECKPLKLSSVDLTPNELIHMMPAKLSNAQLSVLYSALKNLGNKADFDELLEFAARAKPKKIYTLHGFPGFPKHLKKAGFDAEFLGKP